MAVRYKFRPRLITTLAAAAGIALTLALASWQLNRAHEKEGRAAQLGALAQDPPVSLAAAEVRAEDIEWRRVTVRGQFEPRHGVLIDNRIYRGVAGYHVVMPIAIGGGSRYVLVNRGWIAGNPERARLPEVRTPQGTVEITGLAVTPSRRFVELSSRVVEGKVWQNLTLERYRDAFPLALQPVVIQQESPLDDGLVREWDAPDLGVDKHRGYAFQWLALALTILVFYIVTHVGRTAE
jgi:surfeit locus 1 family protein